LSFTTAPIKRASLSLVKGFKTEHWPVGRDHHDLRCGDPRPPRRGAQEPAGD